MTADRACGRLREAMRKAVTRSAAGRARGARRRRRPRAARRRSAAARLPLASCAKASLDARRTTASSRSAPTTRPTRRGSAAARPKGSKWKINDPATGKGFESAVAYAVAKQLGFARSRGRVDVRAVQPVVRAGQEAVRLRHQPDLVSRRRARRSSTSARSYYDVNQAIVVLKGTTIAKVQLGRRPAGRTSSAPSSGRRATTTSRTTIKPSKSPAVFPQNAAAVQALKNKQIDGLVVDLPTAFYVTAVQVPNGDDPRPVPGRRRR